MNMDDIFANLGDIVGGHFGGFGGGFGGGGDRRRGKRVRRGCDLRVRVKLTLKEISTGVEKKIKVKKLVSCTHCNGTGAGSFITEAFGEVTVVLSDDVGEKRPFLTQKNPSPGESILLE